MRTGSGAGFAEVNSTRQFIGAGWSAEVVATDSRVGIAMDVNFVSAMLQKKLAR